MNREFIKAWKVDLIESERGWGKKVIDISYFKTKQKAFNYCRKINSKNIAKTTPSWYMYAEEPIECFVPTNHFKKPINRDNELWLKVDKSPAPFKLIYIWVKQKKVSLQEFRVLLVKLSYHKSELFT